MMPKTINLTRKVELYSQGDALGGLKSFYGFNTSLFEVGYFGNLEATEMIGVDEQIIGVKAKVWTTYRTIYTDFQLMVCKRNK
jgi:hypothetical protein